MSFFSILWVEDKDSLTRLLKQLEQGTYNVNLSKLWRMLSSATTAPSETPKTTWFKDYTVKMVSLLNSSKNRMWFMMTQTTNLNRNTNGKSKNSVSTKLTSMVWTKSINSTPDCLKAERDSETCLLREQPKTYTALSESID